MLEKIKALLGDKFTEELGTKVEAAIAESYVTKVEYEGIVTQKGDLETQMAEANKTIEGFKSMDIDGIKKAAEDYKLQAEQVQKDAASKIADMEFSNLINGAIVTAKGKNTKAIMALLDVDTLKQSKNQAEDIKSAIGTIAKDNDYMFESSEAPPALAAGTGSASMMSNKSGSIGAEILATMYGNKEEK